MQYFILFLEGIITFISPCLLPMLPIYISYFAAGEGENEEKSTLRTLMNALGFIIGFTVVFVLLGALAGTLGALLGRYKTIVNIVTGAVVIFFGLSFIGVFKLKFFKGFRFAPRKSPGFFSSVLFGTVFSIGWTPCVGAFLGSALMIAANQGSTLIGMLMLFIYSLGLGIPFFISALLIDKLKGTFNFIKRHYKVINAVSGSLLIVLGILMATGLFDRLISVLS